VNMERGPAESHEMGGLIFTIVCVVGMRCGSRLFELTDWSLHLRGVSGNLGVLVASSRRNCVGRGDYALKDLLIRGKLFIPARPQSSILAAELRPKSRVPRSY
jgi:hypothetical protein